MKCKVIEDYSSNLRQKIDEWLAKNKGIKIAHIAQCANPERGSNSLSAAAAGTSKIVVTILYEET